MWKYPLSYMSALALVIAQGLLLDIFMRENWWFLHLAAQQHAAGSATVRNNQACFLCRHLNANSCCRQLYATVRGGPIAQLASASAHSAPPPGELLQVLHRGEVTVSCPTSEWWYSLSITLRRHSVRQNDLPCDPKLSLWFWPRTSCKSIFTVWSMTLHLCTMYVQPKRDQVLPTDYCLHVRPLHAIINTQLVPSWIPCIVAFPPNVIEHMLSYCTVLYWLLTCITCRQTCRPISGSARRRWIDVL